MILAALTWSGTSVIAQVEFPNIKENLARDYLAYSFIPYEEPAFHGSIKPIAILATIPARVCVVRSAYAAKKKYRITDDGSFQYWYSNGNEAAPEYRHVTIRTFYLETTRQGIIPSGISYRDFVAMTVAEKQKLLESTHRQAEAGMFKKARLMDATVKYVVTPEGFKILVDSGSGEAELKAYHESDDTDMLFLKLLPGNTSVPLIVRNLLSPADRANISSQRDFNELLDLMKDIGEKTSY